jgi:hypothetical protein
MDKLGVGKTTLKATHGIQKKSCHSERSEESLPSAK